MRFEWATVADSGRVDDGLLSLVRAGWSTYRAPQYPNELNGVVAGYVALDPDEIGLPSAVIVSISEESGSASEMQTGVLLTPALPPRDPPTSDRVPFAVPISTVINAPTTVRVDLFCRARLSENLIFDRRKAGPPDYKLRFSVLPPVVDADIGATRAASKTDVSNGRQSWITRSIEKALDEWQAGDYESAILFAAVALDGTAGRKYPNLGSRRRFTQVIRDNALIFERFGAPGLDVANSRFEGMGRVLRPTAGGHPDVADVIYSIHRCSYAHGDELPAGFQLTDEAAFRMGLDGPGSGASIELPKTAIIGMLAVCLLDPANDGLRVRDKGYELTWTPPGEGSPRPIRLPLNQWFGRREDFVELQARYGRSRVTVQPGDKWPVTIEEGGGTMRITSF